MQPGEAHNDHVNMSQSSNDSFPSAMYIAAGLGVTQIGGPHRRLQQFGALEFHGFAKFQDLFRVSRQPLNAAVAVMSLFAAVCLDACQRQNNFPEKITAVSDSGAMKQAISAAIAVIAFQECAEADRPGAETDS